MTSKGSGFRTEIDNTGVLFSVRWVGRWWAPSCSWLSTEPLTKTWMSSGRFRRGFLLAVWWAVPWVRSSAQGFRVGCSNIPRSNRRAVLSFPAGR